MRYFNRFLLFLAITVTGVTVLGYYWTFVRLSPIYDDEITLAGLENQALVLRDAWGVPDITAASEADAFRVLGWIHAEDRFWQMTVSQLTVEGRFSEFFGADLLPVDRFLRTLDFAAIAKENELLLSEDELSLLKHYAEGVNAWVTANKKRLPIEFALAGINPIPWETHHTLGIARLMAWQLNVTWNGARLCFSATDIDRRAICAACAGKLA
jgi:penicillin amidase